MTSGNPILDKNLECIAKYNPKLRDDLLNLPYLTNDIQLIETELKEPNLSYNALPLHAQGGAEIEAKDIFNKTKNSGLSIHIVFGIGLGYLFKEFCEHSKGAVFLYEPNLEILRVTLELVDFSKEFSQKNVRVFSDMQTFRESFTQSYLYNANSAFIYLGAYKEIYADDMDGIFKQIEIIMGACVAQYNTLKREMTRSISMTLENLADTLESVPLFEFKDIYKGKTAIIVSAGPSLDLNIEIIKKNRDKVVIFCVGTAFKALASNGIKPDFLCIIEINDCSEQVKGFDLSEMNFIVEPYTNNIFQKLKVKQKLLFPTNLAHANKYWAKLTDVDISPYIAKGTVSYDALFSAKILGFSKIILVGQDLAYVGNKCYSDGAAYSELAFEINSETQRPEFKIKNREKYVESLLSIGCDEIQPWYEDFANYKVQNLNDTLYFVKGISGEMLPTQGGYATFIEHFKEFAYLNKDLELINSSMIGAQIDGFNNIPLEQALEDVPIVAKIELSTSFKHDVAKILANLQSDENDLQNILNEFSKAKDYILKYEREFQRRKTVTPEANKFFKQLLGLYDKINLGYQSKSPLYQAIAFNDDIEIQYVIKETEHVDMERIKLVFSLLKNYYFNVEQKLLDVLVQIDKQKTTINESFILKNPELVKEC